MDYYIQKIRYSDVMRSLAETQDISTVSIALRILGQCLKNTDAFTPDEVFFNTLAEGIDEAIAYAQTRHNNIFEAYKSSLNPNIEVIDAEISRLCDESEEELVTTELSEEDVQNIVAGISELFRNKEESNG